MRAKRQDVAEWLVAEFAGPPMRVAINVVLTAGAGILFDYLLFDVALDERLVFGALMGPLLAIVVAGTLKSESKR